MKKKSWVRLAMPAAAGIALAAAAPACGQTAGSVPVPGRPAAALEQVVVTGGVERRAFDAPFSIGVVDAEELRAAGPMVNLSESLARVPGLVVANRNNYAQDLQVSSRGFGARSSFGVRGLRLYTDGIPATMPDGQGQLSHFDLAGADRVEVLRGPFSVLYGNSSGGVISLTSAAPTRRAYTLDGDVGSYGTRQARIGIEGPLGGGWDVRLQASRFHTDGLRPHSAADRTLANLRLGWRGEFDSLLLLVNALDQPADDPLGLTRAQFDADPRQTTPEAFTFDTRKRSRQQQAGLAWTHAFSGLGPLRESRVLVYGGQRSVTQWQAIPVAAQAPATHPGGVIDFDRDYEGLDGRLSWRWERARLVTGVTLERQRDARRGYQNFMPAAAGAPQQLGVTGALRRDERNVATSTDAYAQAEVDFTDRLTGTLGARSGRLRVSTRDSYLANGDDSGDLSWHYTTPVAALRFRAAPSLNLYVSAGRGFESPTLTELAYRPGGATGLNTDLRPQTSRQVEIGAKWRHAPTRLGVDAAIFRADTDDEIAVQSNTGGRATYRNVGRTRRQGAELALRWQAAPAWRTQLALTWLDAVYRDNFACAAGAVGCTPLAVAGNRIAGTLAKSAFAEVAWRAAPATELAVEVRAQGSLPVNDANSDFAPRAVVGALRASHDIDLGAGTLALIGRVDNLTDRSYAGSVIVNEGNGRFFEPAPGRNWYLGARWRGRW